MSLMNVACDDPIP